MTHFAAIPTMYKGVQFRSRLEARWAAFFDQMGRPWQYEPFDLNGWIPDFSWTPGDYEPTPLFEVKPAHPSDDISEVGAKMLRAVGDMAPKYDLWIIGHDPSAMWRLERGQQWIAQSLEGWEPAWRAAGNPVQWKSPVR